MGGAATRTGSRKRIRELRDLPRLHTEEAVSRLVDLMRSDDPGVSVAACQVLLDRGWGKASQRLAADAERHARIRQLVVDSGTLYQHKKFD
jgi:hypothetical protein